MQSIFAWYNSLSPLVYWALMILLTPIWLTLLGLLICFCDPSSIGNYFEEATQRYGSWGYLVGLMSLGAFAGVFLGPLFGVLWYFYIYKNG